MRSIIIAGLVMLMVAAAPSAAAKLGRSVMAAGASSAANATTRVTGTIGQALIGGSAGASQIVCQGYWCVSGIPVVSVPGPDPEAPGIELPKRLEFSGPHPNPASGAVSFELALPAAAAIRLALYDVGGREVASAPVSHLAAGRHSLRWDARTQGIGPGIYFARLDVNGLSAGTRRLVVIR
jgi:hypothetical protein